MASNSKRVRRIAQPAQAPRTRSQAAATREGPVLTAVVAALRPHAELTGQSKLTHLVNDFLDHTCVLWTLENVLAAPIAVEEDSKARLIDHLLAREWSGLDERFRIDRFRCNVARAFRKNKLRILDW